MLDRRDLTSGNDPDVVDDCVVDRLRWRYVVFAKLFFKERTVNTVSHAFRLDANRMKEAKLRLEALWKRDSCEFALRVPPFVRRLLEEADRVLSINGRNEVRQQVVERLRV